MRMNIIIIIIVLVIVIVIVIIRVTEWMDGVCVCVFQAGAVSCTTTSK